MSASRLQGSRPAKLDACQIAELSASIERGRQKLGVPGVPIGPVQDGTVVFARGVVVKEIGGTTKPDAPIRSHHRVQHEGDDARDLVSQAALLTSSLHADHFGVLRNRDPDVLQRTRTGALPAEYSGQKATSIRKCQASPRAAADQRQLSRCRLRRRSQHRSRLSGRTLERRLTHISKIE